MPCGKKETLTYHSDLLARRPKHSFRGTQRYLEMWDFGNKTGTVPG